MFYDNTYFQKRIGTVVRLYYYYYSHRQRSEFFWKIVVRKNSSSNNRSCVYYISLPATINVYFLNCNRIF